MNKILMLMMGCCALVCYSGCGSEKEERNEEIQFLVTSPLKTDTFITKDYVCQIRSIHHIELRAQARGYLQKIFVDEGQFVRKGQLLFQIMPLLYEAEFQKAQAEVNFAEIEYQNTKKLADSDVVAPNELAMAKAKLDKARAELSLAAAHLAFTEIRAPFDGIIDRFLVRPGSLVDEGELLSSLSDNSRMWVYYNVSEAEYLDYISANKTNEPARVELLMANNKLFDHPGIVETIEADFNNETGNIAFRATFPNPKGLLRHGETGNIKMTEPFKRALIIPQKATFEMLDRKYAYVVDENNIIHLKQIIIAAEMPDLYIIADGIQEGDKILLEGVRKVKDNDKIAFHYEEPASVIAHLKLPTE